MSEIPSISPDEYTPLHASGITKDRRDRHNPRHANEPAPVDRTMISEALQDFTHHDESIDDAHTEAIKIDLAMRKDADYNDYIDHLQEMSEQEKNGDIEGKLYTRRLKYENVRSDAEAYLDEKKDSAKAVGAIALNAGRGAMTLATRAVNKRVLEYQFDRANKKHMKELHTEAIKENNEFDARIQREARRKKVEALREKRYGPALRLGRRALSFADRAYMTGLEASNPAKAAEIMAQRKQAKKAEALSTLNVDIQLDKTKDLLSDPLYQPYERVSGDLEGYLSEVFTSEDMPDIHLSILYEEHADGMVQPQLLSKEEGSEWRRASHLLPENYPGDNSVSDQLTTVADRLLRESKKDGEPTMDSKSLLSLVRKLNSKPPVEGEIVSGFRLDREARMQYLKEKREIETRIQTILATVKRLQTELRNKKSGSNNQLRIKQQLKTENTRLAQLTKELQRVEDTYAALPKARTTKSAA